MTGIDRRPTRRRARAAARRSPSSVVFAVLLAALLAADLGAPLRAIARSVDRVSAGDDRGRLELPGDDEFSRLAESHNRLARDLAPPQPRAAPDRRRARVDAACASAPDAIAAPGRRPGAGSRSG